MTLRDVTIGDKFINPFNNKSKRISTVVDFIQRKSLVSEIITGYSCIVESETLGKKIRSEVAFATVKRNRI